MHSFTFAMRALKNRGRVGFIGGSLFVGVFLILGCKGGVPNLDSEDIETSANSQSYVTDPDDLAALEAICAQAEIPGLGLSAIITRGTSGTISNYFSGNIAEGYQALLPLTNQNNEILIFDYDQIHTPSSGSVADQNDVLIELASTAGTETMVVADGSPFQFDFAFLYEGSIINNSGEKKSYYYATRSDDAARMEVKIRGNWRQITDQGPTGVRLVCSPPEDLITVDVGEIFDFRVIWTQAGGGHAMSLLRKEIVDHLPVDSPSAIDPACGQNASIAALESRGWEVVPPEVFHASRGLIPEGWTDQCFELGFGAF